MNLSPKRELTLNLVFTEKYIFFYKYLNLCCLNFNVLKKIIEKNYMIHFFGVLVKKKQRNMREMVVTII